MILRTVEELSQYFDNKINGAKKAIAEATTVLESNIILDTPPDSGNARSRWTASLDVPQTDPNVWTGQDANPEGAYRNMVYHRTESPSSRYAMNKNQDVINNSGGHVLYLVNDTEYISSLEMGRPQGERFSTSLQAPMGFVRKNVPNYDKYLEKALREVD